MKVTVGNHLKCAKRLFRLFSSAAWVSLSLFILAEKAFSNSLEDNQIYKSAYHLGRGNTGIACSEDHESMMYNPAGIAVGKGIYKRVVLASPMIEFSSHALSLARDLSDSEADTTSILRDQIGKNQHLGIYNLTAIVFRRAALGVVASATTDILVAKSPDAGGLEGVEAKAYQTVGPVFTIGESFLSESLHLGTTIKYLQRGQANFAANITNSEALKDLKSDDLLKLGTGLGVDLGLLYQMKSNPNITMGLTIQNLGNTKFTKINQELGAPDPLLQTVNLGVAMVPNSKVSNFKLLLDYWDATSRVSKSTFKKLKLGAEISVMDSVGVTTGFSEGWSSAGVYADLRIVRVDGGMYIQEVTERIGMRPDKRIFVRVSAGF